MTRPTPVVRRLWEILAAMCTGLLIGWHVALPSVLLLAIASIVAAAMIFFSRAVMPLLLVVAALFAGMAMAAARASRGAALQEMAAAAAECRIRGSVTESSGLGTFARVQHARCEGFAPVTDPGTVVVDDNRLDLGREFEARGRLAALSDDSFDVARIRLSADAIFYPDALSSRPAGGPRRFPSRFRAAVSEAAAGLDARTGALLLGLTIGDTSEFDEQTLEHFRRSGLAHLLAVSGSNVAIVVGTVALCLARAGARTRLVSCGAALAFYVIVVGPDPSVVRAAAMGGLGLAGMIWGHRPEPLGALALALIAALALRPGFLFSVGLHLSAAATAGLILWSRPLAHALSYKMPRVLAWPLGATTAAQVAVAPLLVLTFGEVSVVAPLANIAALPAVVPATILGLAAGVAGAFSDGAGTLLAVIASVPSAWIAACAEIFGTPSWAQVAAPPAAGWMVLALVSVAALATARFAREVN